MTYVYCNRSEQLPREHVYPAFLLRASEKPRLFYSKAANGYFETDAVIRKILSRSRFAETPSAEEISDCGTLLR